MRLPTQASTYSKKESITTISLPKALGIEKSYIVVNDKDKFRLIKTIETIVRTSTEYKQYIQFLKDEIDMEQCSFFKNISNKSNRGISIEIHHEPFTLFDLTMIVVDKYIDLNIPLNPLTISEEVMGLHYKNMVGLIPLSITVHQLVHDGQLFIPLQNVYGNYLKLIDEYGDYISENIKEVLQAKLRMSKEITEPDYSILQKRFVYIDVDGFTLPQHVEKK